MAGEDPPYCHASHELPCAAPAGHQCRGPIEAHHAGTRLGPVVKGGDRRAHDHTIVPLCKQSHTDWHNSAGPFRGWAKAKRRDWSDEKIAETWARLSHEATIPLMHQPTD